MQIRTDLIIAPFRRLSHAAMFALSLSLMTSAAFSEEAAESAAVQEAAAEAPSDPAADDTELMAPADSVGGLMGEVTLEKFIPTEEISADGAVSFPVDI